MNDNLLKVLLGWLQDFFAGMQDWFGKGAMENLSRHWILWVVLLIAVGFLIDKTVYFFRFRPDRRVKEAVRSFRSVMKETEQEEKKPEEINEYGYVTYREEVSETVSEEEYNWEQTMDNDTSVSASSETVPEPSSVPGKIQDRELDPKPDGPVPIGVYHGPRQKVPFGVVAEPASGRKPEEPTPKELVMEETVTSAGETESYELENMRDLSQTAEEELYESQNPDHQE